MGLRRNGEHAGGLQYSSDFGESPEWSGMMLGSEPLIDGCLDATEAGF